MSDKTLADIMSDPPIDYEAEVAALRKMPKAPCDDGVPWDFSVYTDGER